MERERRRGSHNGAMLLSFSRRRQGLILGLLAVAIVTVVAQFLSRDDEIPPPRSGGPAPVVLVHGYGGDSSSMAAIAARLDRQGLSVTSVDLPGGGTGDIRQSAATVAQAVEAAGAPYVDLVGFSAGGVVVRSYLEHYDGLDRTRFVITLGSPHHGTSIAGAAVLSNPGLCVDACEQMTPGSAFLEELNEPDETPPGPVFMSVWTRLDETVTPPETAELDGAINVEVQAVCPGSAARHGDLVRDPMVLGLIVETLAGGVQAPPDEDQCQRLSALGR
jgi:triacylglycerol esterase/lipase EstA (alpha/beta hydrolase family)